MTSGSAISREKEAKGAEDRARDGFQPPNTHAANTAAKHGANKRERKGARETQDRENRSLLQRESTSLFLSLSSSLGAEQVYLLSGRLEGDEGVALNRTRAAGIRDERERERERKADARSAQGPVESGISNGRFDRMSRRLLTSWRRC